MVWTIANTILLGRDSFDPYPFIFLNLILSMIAALQAPVIMMSQNRQAERDRIDAGHDYEVNLKAEIEIMALHEKLDELRHRELIEVRDDIKALAALLDRIEQRLARGRSRRMTDTFHWLIARYGLIAVFLGCVAEGESAAILGGFFAHQKVFELWQTFAVAFAGSFVGDTLLFLVGRRFSNHPLVARMRRKPGFAHA